MGCYSKIILDGTSQGDRFTKMLASAELQVEERSTVELLSYLYKVAAEFNYYNSDNRIDGTFQQLLPDPDTLKQLIQSIQWDREDFQSPGFAPHVGLLLTCLKLFEYLKADINLIPKKQLAFFYEDLLKFEKKKLVVDKVHVAFELKKNVDFYQLKKEDLLSAGKDENKNPVWFAPEREILIKPIHIKSLSSIFVDKEQQDRIYYAPVANSIDGKGEAFSSENTAWPAFGESQKLKTTRSLNMLEAEIGLAITSPAFFLKEGDRTIKLTFNCNLAEDGTASNQTIINGLSFYFSGEKKWIKATVVSIAIQQGETQSQKKVYCEIKLNEGDDATTLCNPEVHEIAIDSAFPVLKIVLNHNVGFYKYGLFKDLKIVSLKIETTVTKVKTLLVQNDLGTIDPAKPFLPFGTTPGVGSSLYIGCQEVFKKTPQSITINIRWLDIPENGFGAHYNTSYGVSVSNSSFIVGVNVLQDGTWTSLGDPTNIFNELNPDKKLRIIPLNIESETIKRNPLLDEKKRFGNEIKNGFLNLRFLGSGDGNEKMKAFGHEEYTNLYTNAAIKKAKDGVDTATFPNRPYTPQISELFLNYTSEDNIHFSALGETEKFYHIEPFGVKEVIGGNNPFMFPGFHYEGNFLIGIEAEQLSGNVNFLFQVATGTGVINPGENRSDIEWSYLATHQKWEKIEPENIVFDATDNLLNSGVIEFSLGKDAVKSTTLFEESLYWIAGRIKSFTKSANKLIAIIPNAVSTKYILPDLKGNTAGLLNLTGGEISKFQKRIPQIKKVLQPFSSFGGRNVEDAHAFYARVSERLRHKNRAVSCWDYERIILETFPEIYKVKCLPATDLDGNILPGATTIILIPELNKNKRSLEPKSSLSILLAVKNFIKKLASPFVKVFVDNPVYEQLLVECNVGFHSEFDAGLYEIILNESLKELLSPWFFGKGNDLAFGQKIRSCDILTFIENLPYVDFVLDFKLYHIFSEPACEGIGFMEIEQDFLVWEVPKPAIGEMEIGADFIVGYESVVAVASSPKSVLVSAESHRIKAVEPHKYNCNGGDFGGIGFWSVELDLEVSLK